MWVLLRRKNGLETFLWKSVRAKSSLELVHTDLCWPTNMKSRGDYDYFITFTNFYSRFCHINILTSQFFWRFYKIQNWGWQPDVHENQNPTIRWWRWIPQIPVWYLLDRSWHKIPIVCTKHDITKWYCNKEIVALF